MDWGFYLRDHIMEIHVICATMMHTPDQTSTCECYDIGGVPVFKEDI